MSSLPSTTLRTLGSMAGFFGDPLFLLSGVRRSTGTFGGEPIAAAAMVG